MIDEAGRVAVDGGIDDRLLVDAKHVAAHSLGFVVLLALVAHHRTDHLAGVFHHHFPALFKQNQINYSHLLIFFWEGRGMRES